MNANEPAVYIASLSDYNAGILHGRWFSLEDYETVDEWQQAINDMLAESPTAKEEGVPAEEWAIHDTNNLPRIVGEYTSLDVLVALADAYSSLWGDAVDAFNVYLDDRCDIHSADDIEDALGDFNTAYQETYASKEDFAEEFLEDSGMMAKIPEWAQPFFDMEAYARDLFMGDFTAIQDEITRNYYVFAV